MQIRQVTRRADRRAFIGLPARLYADLPLWVPPLHRDERFMMSRRHPFYRHSEAAFFVVEDDREVVGRIAVLDHRRWNDHSGALFDTAATWAAKRGLTGLAGPMGMLPTDGHGILVEGFEVAPVLGVGYHPDYYDRLIKATGFIKATDYLSGRLAVDHDLPPEVFAAADAVAATAGYTITTPGTRRELRRWLEPLGVAYNSSFTNNWEYAPIDAAELKAIAAQFVPVSDPRLIGFLMHGSEVAGYILILPDIAAAVRQARGRLTPLAVLRIMRAVKTTPRVNLLGFGIAPGHRGEGANLVMYATLARRAADFRFTSAEVVQVDEANAAMMRNMARLGVPWTKRHRVYRRAG